MTTFSNIEQAAPAQLLLLHPECPTRNTENDHTILELIKTFTRLEKYAKHALDNKVNKEIFDEAIHTPKQAVPSVPVVHDNAFGPPTPVITASALATDDDPFGPPTSAPTAPAPFAAAADSVIAVKTKMAIKAAAPAFTRAAAPAPVARRGSLSPWTPCKKLTSLKAQEAKDVLQRFKAKLTGTKGEASTASTPVSVGACSRLQDYSFELGVAGPSSTTAMQASLTRLTRSTAFKAGMALFANVRAVKASASKSAKKQRKPAPMLPVAFEDDMDEKAMEIKVVANIQVAEPVVSKAAKKQRKARQMLPAAFEDETNEQATVPKTAAKVKTAKSLIPKPAKQQHKPRQVLAVAFEDEEAAEVIASVTVKTTNPSFAMQASGTPSAPLTTSLQAGMGLFADVKITKSIKKQHKAREILPIAFDDDMDEKPTVITGKPFASAQQALAHLASLSGATMPTGPIVAPVFKPVKSPSFFRPGPAGSPRPSQRQLSLGTPRAIVRKLTFFAPIPFDDCGDESLAQVVRAPSKPPTPPAPVVATPQVVQQGPRLVRAFWGDWRPAFELPPQPELEAYLAGHRPFAPVRADEWADAAAVAGPSSKPESAEVKEQYAEVVRSPGHSERVMAEIRAVSTVLKEALASGYFSPMSGAADIVATAAAPAATFNSSSSSSPRPKSALINLLSADALASFPPGDRVAMVGAICECFIMPP
ncbi:hypothetical protein V8E36_008413 [Tilletia maclaganii]